MSELKKLFGARLRELRKQRKITQEKFAELMDFSPRNLSRIETGVGFPTTENLEKIIEILDIDPKELFDFQHTRSREELLEETIENIKNNPQKIKEFYKVVKALID